MISRIVFALLLIGVVVSPSVAQSNDPRILTQYISFYTGPPAAGWQCVERPDGVPVTSPIVCYIRRADSACVPSVPSRCPKCGEPIDLTSGNTYIDQMDFALPGLGGGLTLSRTWNSRWAALAYNKPVGMGMFGSGWRSTYEERIFSDNYGMTYSRADGTFWYFGAGGSGWAIAAPANTGITLASGDPHCGSTGICFDTHWKLTYKNGEQRIFDINSGLLQSITDRNGNKTQLAYDTKNRPITVTDPAGRVITFSYPDETTALVSSVTSPAGTFAYDYVDGYLYGFPYTRLLHKVTRPDGSFVKFEYGVYGDQFLITAVRDSDDKLLEAHDYDSYCRGISSTRANGVDALTISYRNELASDVVYNSCGGVWAQCQFLPTHCQASTGGTAASPGR